MSDTVKTEVMITKNEDAMRDIGSFADAMQLLRESGVEVHSTEEYGDGFKLLANEQKNQLVKVPFVILGMKFAEGDFGEFVIIHLVTEDGRKCIITDGSTGIRDQAVKYRDHGITTGLLVPNGLVRSDYTYTDPSDGKEKNATTYYLS